MSGKPRRLLEAEFLPVLASEGNCSGRIASGEKRPRRGTVWKGKIQ